MFVPTSGNSVPVSSFVSGVKIEPIHLNEYGQLIGTTDVNGSRRGFLADALSGAGTKIFPDFTPLALNNNGIVVGHSGSPSKAKAAVYNGQAQYDLPLSAAWSQAVAVTNSGKIAGNYENQGKRRGFVYFASKVTDLGDLGGGETEVLGINEAGDVFGRSLNSTSKTWQAVVYDSKKQKLQPVPVPAGLKGSVATAANSMGWVGGHYIDGNGQQRAFLADGQGKFIDLTSKHGKSTGATFTEVARVNDDNTVLVRGLAGQTDVAYRLQPKNQP
jgi:hypothetical protein